MAIRPIYYSGRQERINVCLDQEVLAMVDVMASESMCYSRSGFIASLIVAEFNRRHPDTDVHKHITKRRKRHKKEF